MVQSQSTPSIEPTTLGHACRFPTLATDDAAALAALAALWARHPATVVPSLTIEGTTHLIDLRPGTHPPYIRHHLMHTGTGNAHATANPQSRCRFTQKKAPHTPLCKLLSCAINRDPAVHKNRGGETLHQWHCCCQEEKCIQQSGSGPGICLPDIVQAPFNSHTLQLSHAHDIYLTLASPIYR